MKTVKISDFLTEDEIVKVAQMYLDHRNGSGGDKPFATLVAESVISPNIDRINQILGQENDPRYLAYVIEFALMGVSE